MITAVGESYVAISDKSDWRVVKGTYNATGPK